MIRKSGPGKMAGSSAAGRTVSFACPFLHAAGNRCAPSRCSDAIALNIILRKKTVILPLDELADTLDDSPLHRGRACASPRRLVLAEADRDSGFFRKRLKERRKEFVTSLRVSRFRDKLPPLVDHPFFG